MWSNSSRLKPATARGRGGHRGRRGPPRGPALEVLTLVLVLATLALLVPELVDLFD
jgi:hypothetical protein